MASQRRVRVLIAGRVQGVYYRASTLAKARELEVSGWVRNLTDGRVEVVAAGPGPAVEGLLEWCRRGPAGARVDKLEIEDVEGGADMEGFSIIH